MIILNNQLWSSEKWNILCLFICCTMDSWFLSAEDSCLLSHSTYISYWGMIPAPLVILAGVKKGLHFPSSWQITPRPHLCHSPGQFPLQGHWILGTWGQGRSIFIGDLSLGYMMAVAVYIMSLVPSAVPVLKVFFNLFLFCAF